jgi:hypothetical protein
MLALQRTIGNRAVGRLLDERATGKLPPELREQDDQVPVTGLWSDIAGAFAFVSGAPAAAPAVSGKPKKPAKLTKRTEKRAKAGDCGEFTWVVQWKLDRPSPAGGWVVQKVEVDRDVTDCDGNDSPASVSGGLDPSWYPLWEAWQIRAGQKVTTYAQDNNDREDDTYGSDSQPDTKGSLKVTGTAEFYEGLSLPADFQVTNAAPTWILPATNTAPTLAGGTGAIAHDLTATWDCCGSNSKKKKTKISTR